MLAKIVLTLSVPKDSLFCSHCIYKDENDFCKVFSTWLAPHGDEDDAYRDQQCLNAEMDVNK